MTMDIKTKVMNNSKSEGRIADVPMHACPVYNSNVFCICQKNKDEFRSRPIRAFVYIFALSQSEYVKRVIT
jgi:hypothetical protein